MRIAIDAVAANQKIRTGAGEYAFRLLQAMMKETPSQEEVSLFTDQALGDAWGKLPLNWRSWVLAWPLPGWRSLRLNMALLASKPDVAFFPSSHPPLFAPSRHNKKRANVATVHDVGFARLPHLYPASDRRRQRLAVQKVIKKCVHLLAVSEFTKEELVSLYRVDASRITVVPPGLDRAVYQAADADAVLAVRRKEHLSQNYFLFVSRVDAKKNVEGLLRAFTIFKEARGFGDPHELVIAGPPGFGYERVRDLVESSPIRSSIHLLGAVSEAEKAALYTGALGYVNLSWYEGFGLTPLEAAACGTPSLLSDIPAHREVMGDGAVYVSPKAPEEVAAAWKHFAEEGSRREDVLLKAQARLDLFSSEKTAQETWEVLRGVLAPLDLFETRL